MKNSKSSSRAQRRSYEKYLKKYHPDQYSQWKSSSIKRGEDLHNAHIQSTDKNVEDQIQNIQNKIIKSHNDFFKCDESLSRKYSEDCIISTKLWRNDEYVKFKDINDKN